MTAIWPAGPPKLSAATLSQTQNASANDGIAPLSGTGRAPMAAGALELGELVDDMVRP